MSTSLDKQAEKLAHMLGLHTWDMGDDGFGGEYVADEKRVKQISDYLEYFATQVREQTVQETITKIFEGGFYEIAPIEELHKFLIAAPPETTEQDGK